jgi:MFS transporter, ACS family, glucarate transporter
MNRKYGVLLILSVLSIITFLDRNAISLAGHRITEELGLTEYQFGWILSAFTISYGLFEIPTGLLGDRFGAKKILARVVIWWSAFTVLTGLSGGFASLFLIRFLFGAGEAGAYPNTAIAIRQWFPVIERGRAQAVIWMASRLGGALTPFLVIPLQIQFGWRVSFYVLGALGLLWVIVWLIWYKNREEEPVTPVAPDLHIVHKPSWNVWVKSGNFWLLMLMYYCYASGVFFFISWLPKYLQNGRGIPEDQLAYSASLPFFLAAIGCLMGGAISDFLVKKIGLVWGRRLVPLIGLSLSGTSMLLAAFTASNSVAIVFLALGLAFMDVTAPVSWAVATELGGKDSGAVTGAMNTAGLLGGTITSLGIGYLITTYGSYQLPVVILGIVLIVGSLLWLLIKADKPLVPSEIIV